jgi:4-hydroxybenzoate polyprenyltransferase
LACLFLFNPTTIICALLLAVAILVYDAIHKIFAFSPVLMAVCRFLLLLLAASTGWQGITGLAIWTALVLGAYIIGLSYLARKESTLVSRGYWPCAFLAAPLVLAFVVITGLAIRTALVLGAYIIGLIYLARKESLLASLRYWPCAFLAAPLVLAFVVNQGEHHLRAVILCLAIGLWMLRCLRFAFWSAQRNIGRCVAGLLAGIPLVDLLSVWDGSPLMAGVFLGLFVLALVFQRYVPAT